MPRHDARLAFPTPPLHPSSANVVEGVSLLKNSLGARSGMKAGTKHTDWGLLEPDLWSRSAYPHSPGPMRPYSYVLIRGLMARHT
jgi:hypothetical protein